MDFCVYTVYTGIGGWGFRYPKPSIDTNYTSFSLWFQPIWNILVFRSCSPRIREKKIFDTTNQIFKKHIWLELNTLTLLQPFALHDTHSPMFSWRQSLKIHPRKSLKAEVITVACQSSGGSIPTSVVSAHENYGRSNDDMWDFQHSRCNLPTKITRAKNIWERTCGENDL